MIDKVSLVVLVEGSISDWQETIDFCGLEQVTVQSEILCLPDTKKLCVGAVDVELIVGLVGKNAKVWKTLFSPLTEKITEFEDVGRAAAYNALFRQCSSKYICILRPNIYLDELWLLDLVYYYETINEAGVVSIPSKIHEMSFVPLLDKDQEKMVGVFMPNDNYVSKNSIIFFNRQLLYLVGALDESPEAQGTEWMQFEMRTERMGYHNFFITTQACVSLFKGDTFNQSLHDSVKKQVDLMAKEKRLYLPL